MAQSATHERVSDSRRQKQHGTLLGEIATCSANNFKYSNSFLRSVVYCLSHLFCLNRPTICMTFWHVHIVLWMAVFSTKKGKFMTHQRTSRRAGDITHRIRVTMERHLPCRITVWLCVYADVCSGAVASHCRWIVLAVIASRLCMSERPWYASHRLTLYRERHNARITVASPTLASTTTI